MSTNRKILLPRPDLKFKNGACLYNYFSNLGYGYYHIGQFIIWKNGKKTVLRDGSIKSKLILFYLNWRYPNPKTLVALPNGDITTIITVLENLYPGEEVLFRFNEGTGLYIYKRVLNYEKDCETNKVWDITVCNEVTHSFRAFSHSFTTDEVLQILFQTLRKENGLREFNIITATWNDEKDPTKQADFAARFDQ